MSQKLTPQKPPIVFATQWKKVMGRARGRCQCRGECGNKHTATRGRCHITNADVGKPPLVAAPVDLDLVLRIAPVLADAPLMALCQPCYVKALNKAKKAAKAEPEPTEPMFDLP